MKKSIEHPNVIAARARGRLTQQQRKQKRIKEYNKNPKRCLECKTPIPYGCTNNKFCNHSCSATFSNTRRLKPRGNCKNCNKELKTRSSKTYCSIQCQINFQYKKFDEIVLSNKGSSSQVRKYLLRTYGHVCQDPDCVWDFKKRPITVEMDHKDGNHENNTLENCRLLCRNCHSLTPTYGGKNRGKGRFSRRQRYHEGKSF